MQTATTDSRSSSPPGSPTAPQRLGPATGDAFPAFLLNRRSLLRNGLRAAAWLTSGTAVAGGDAAPADDASATGLLDSFIETYLAEMNCPGLTLGLASREGEVRAKSYGFSDRAARVPVTTAMLFEIGSITKSFVAIILLQLREEGKLDLDQPVLEYLPWLPVETPYGAITVHHLLSHTSGLPDALNLFGSDPHARLVQGFQPGAHFHYSNAGFQALGFLIEKLDGRPWFESVANRIFAPLGMRDSFGTITSDTLERRAKSWVPRYDDQPEGRNAELVPAGPFMFGNSAGSICSTPGDMARYMQMFIGRGQGPKGRVLSEESFRLMIKPVIESKPLGASSFYGYGIAVDGLDGHTVLRHTGGMASFVSSILIDLDGGFGAFASINAGHNFRPNPVTLYAIQLLNAEAQRKALPPRPLLPDPNFVAGAIAYQNTYISPGGRSVEAAADGTRLTLRINGDSVPLEMAEQDVFIAAKRPFSKFPFVFVRAANTGTEPQPAAVRAKEHPHSAASLRESGPKGPFVELLWGADWYVSEAYRGPRENRPVPELAAYEGHYRAESPWAGSIRVVQRRGQLWLDGTTPLSPIGPDLFRAGVEPWIPETASFHHVAGGRPQLLKLSGFDFWRIDAP